jgi:cobalt-zinc-cadmium efflux system membrane fusion protein
MKHRIPSLGLLALLGVAGCGKGPAPAPEPPSATIHGETITYPTDAPQLAYVTVQAAQPRRLAVTHLTGRLYLSDDSTVRVFTPVAGQVTAVDVEVGQAVSAGGALAEINSPDYGQALADARSADASLLVADKALARSKELLDHGAVAEKDVEAAQAAYGAASAERDRASARLKLYHGSETGTDEVYVLRSPFGGIVVEKNINPGQEVRADQMLANATNLFAPLFVIGDPTKLWIQIDASETDLADLRPGQKIRITSKAFPDKVFDGAVANIGPSLDPSTRTVRVRGIVENPELMLKAEMYVSVDVVRDESKLAQAGVEVPSKAIFTIDRKSYLFVELSPGKFERRQVEIGTEKDGKVPVLGGVAAGQRIVIDGGLLLQAVLDPAN